MEDKLSAGIKVATDSEKITAMRKTIMELLLASAPANASLRDYAADMGVQPHQGAGYLDVTDPKNQQAYTEHYGRPVPAHVGYRATGESGGHARL